MAHTSVQLVEGRRVKRLLEVREVGRRLATANNSQVSVTDSLSDSLTHSVNHLLVGHFAEDLPDPLLQGVQSL